MKLSRYSSGHFHYPILKESLALNHESILRIALMISRIDTLVELYLLDS